MSYEYMKKYVKKSLQYKKTVTCNISVSESFGCTTPASPQLSDLPADIEAKLSTP